MLKRMNLTSASPAATKKLAAQLASALGKEQKDHARVLALTGDLGAGKTTFVQGFARALGVKEPVLSPTFVIQKSFKLPRGGVLYHIDCYRLKDAGELRELGWQDIVSDSKNIVLVEWADRVKSALPKDALRISFSHAGGSQRIIIVDQRGRGA